MKTVGALGAATIVMAAALSAAFAGTKLETTTKPSGPVVRAKNILVFMVIKDPDRRSRAEEIFAGEISLRGGTVTPSYRLFPELPKDKEAAVAKVVSEGFDGIIVANLVGEETKVKWHDGVNTMQPEYMGMDWWGGYWFTYEQVALPGYMENKSRARIKFDFWRLEGTSWSLAWSGTSDSIDPRISPAAGRDVIVAVSKDLAKKGLI